MPVLSWNSYLTHKPEANGSLILSRPPSLSIGAAIYGYLRRNPPGNWVILAAYVVCWVPIVLDRRSIVFRAFWLVERICRSIVGGNRKYLRTRLGCSRKRSERARVPSERARNYVKEGWCHEARRRDTACSRQNAGAVTKNVVNKFV